MLRNYFITAVRNIVRNKVQTIIQVVSLTIGITAAIIIGLYVQHEFSYDNFHEKKEWIYRIEFGKQVGQWSAIGHQIKQEIPEMENVVRILNWGGKDRILTLEYFPENDSLNKQTLEFTDAYYCDSSIFEVFTIPLIQGDPVTALKTPGTCVLSESTARRIFGDKDPVGESFGMGYITITGVFKDLENSHIDINMLISISTFPELAGYPRGHPNYQNEYNSASYMTYVLLPEGMNHSHAEKRIDSFFKEKWKNSFNYDPANIFQLRNLEDIYFSSNLEREVNTFNHGNLGLLRILISIALFILVLGIINYINLTTARATLRSKEIGLRKVTGSSKPELISQFLVESWVVTLISFLLALALTWLLLLPFNDLASTDLNMQFLSKPAIWMMILLLVLILGFLSGIYPAIYLTGFLPVSSLSGEQVRGRGSVVFRRILLTFQFTISIILIICVIVIFRQLHYMKTADLGFNQELVVNYSFWLWQQDHSKRQLINEELIQNPQIKVVAFSSGMAGGEDLVFPDPLEFNGISKYTAWLGIDPGFLEVMGTRIVDGRNFSRDRPGDFVPELGESTYRILVNETFIREFELENSAGTVVTNRNGYPYEIIGVMNDFHFVSLHEEIQPTMFAWQRFLPILSVKISPVNINATLTYIKSVLSSIFPEVNEANFRYTFLDETYARQYLKDENTIRIIINFALVAILIACLGLFGLSSFMATRKIKEIGIRKAFGASVPTVFMLLAREFIRWIALSVVLACPVAWIIMHRWIQNFAYRTTIAWWIFAMAILLAFIITFVTVTWQSLKTAQTNPVDALRYE